MTEPRSAETRDVHRVYWQKLTNLHRETVELILGIGCEGDDDSKAGARQICELLASHQVTKSIEQARFLSNYSGENSSIFERICTIIENYEDTLPEGEHQAVAIVYNLCGTDQIMKIIAGEIPEICSKAMIFLSGRRRGFVLERMEMTLIVIAKAMETEKGGK